ncbi:sulfite exporter TauE/SafE family protein [Ensifer sp. LCM 4579]|uniref:sulfite exporter TauE/SafE family protein n=1 Tax=Ensifer sp. LCM 4579 TaxID=1848292 RepID=UPI0008DA5A31|nr:sulfite exporter TauE/SafE family protein [Ensifer sp. LCM 4579]OHV80024.1 hypothetical protein LCM4579_22790 [Ensifer sp. LCM 4579]
MASILVVLGLIGFALFTDGGQEALLSSSATAQGSFFILCGSVILSAVAFLFMVSLATKRWHQQFAVAAASMFMVAFAVAVGLTGSGRQVLIGVLALAFALVPWLWFRSERGQVKTTTVLQARRFRILALALLVFLTFAVFAAAIGRIIGPVASCFAIGGLIVAILGCLARMPARKYLFRVVIASTVAGFVFYRAAPIREIPEAKLFSIPAAVACPNAAAPAGMMQVETSFDCWLASNQDKDGQATMFLVESAGGGIRAAEWTATVLSELDRQVPDFSNRLFAISSVSGGSLGSAIYAGELAERPRRPDCRPSQAGGLSPCVRAMLDGEFLGPVVASALSGDLLRAIFWPAARLFEDRGISLERALERAWADAYGSPLFASSLSALWPRRPWPALIMNATLTSRGLIAVTSNLGDAGAPTLTLPDIEIFGLGLPTTRVSTAVVNSARFPGISPGGRFTIPWGTDASGAPFPMNPTMVASYPGKVEERYFDTLIDGGYVDDYGASSLLRLIEQLDDIQCDKIRERAKDENLYARSCSDLLTTKRFVRYVLIQITSDPTLAGRCDAPPGLDQGLDTTISETPDIMSPFLTLMSTRSLAGLGLSKRLSDHLNRLHLGDTQSRTWGTFAAGDKIVQHTYFHFGLGPLEELPPFEDQAEEFAFLTRMAQRRQHGDPEADIERESQAETRRRLKQEASRWVQEPTFEGHVPPLTWGLAPASKAAVARHFKQCGPWAVPQIQEIASNGLYYPRPELASHGTGSSKDQRGQDKAAEGKHEPR